MTCNSALGRLSFEGAQVQGREAIVTKLTVGFSELLYFSRLFRSNLLSPACVLQVVI